MLTVNEGQNIVWGTDDSAALALIQFEPLKITNHKIYILLYLNITGVA